MEDVLKTVAVILLLLPGFLVDRFIAALMRTRARSTLEVVVDALIRTLCILAGYLFLAWVLNAASQACGWPQALFCLADVRALPGGPALGKVNLGSVCLLLLCTAGYALLELFFRQRGWHLRLFRCRPFRFSTRGIKVDLWEEVFSDEKVQWVAVVFKDGRRAEGYVIHFSDSGDEAELVLGDVVIWKDGQGRSVDALFVLRKSEVETIEVHRYPGLVVEGRTKEATHGQHE
jgi:hypothetical protein